jgi:hypothetical protein
MYANDFFEILPAISSNTELKRKIVSLVSTRPIPGKALEGTGRDQKFREILLEIINQVIPLEESYAIVEQTLPSSTSIHAGNNKVFPTGWGERLARIQLSRFYNQAILEDLHEKSIPTCFIPHSDHEAKDSSCTVNLAGRDASVSTLLALLVDTYEKGNFNKEPKIPNHPHCTHVVRPI